MCICVYVSVIEFDQVQRSPCAPTMNRQTEVRLRKKKDINISWNVKHSKDFLIILAFSCVRYLINDTNKTHSYLLHVSMCCTSSSGRYYVFLTQKTF